MTNAIEQAKREMYEALQYGMINLDPNSVIGVIFGKFESALEAYLELLRQDHEALHETARARFEDIGKLEAANQDLIQRLAKMTEERDSIQLRLHAVDHAYSEQQSKLHPCMVEEKGLQEDWDAEYKCDSGKPRKCLHDVCKARKNAISTMHRESGDRASCAKPDAKAMAFEGAVMDVQGIVEGWAIGDLKAKKAMRRIAGIVNGPAVHSAMLGLGKSKTCMYSFFAIGDDQMKCTFCGVGK